MFRYFFTNETTPGPLQEQIDAVLQEMTTVGPDSEEYPKLLTTLQTLYTLRDANRPKPVSRESLVLVAGNLLGILLIVAYEQKHVMNQKSFSHVIRPLK